MIYSFDIFDTTLTRVVSHPQDIFILIQHELKKSEINLPESLRHHFPKMRIKAERMARIFKKKEDVTFADIYTRFAKLYSIDPATIELLKQLELKTELFSCRPIAKTIIEINKARQKGAKIIFSSNMYLPKNHMQDMLERVDAYQPGDEIYISGEIGLSKGSGNLFRYILKKEGIAAQELTHLGDNSFSDIFIPSILGIQTVRCSSKLNRYERTIRQSVKKDALLSSLVCGASKNVRLSSTIESLHQQTTQEVSCSVIGPSFLFFVWWVIDSAHKQGLRRLYFLSRDGEILLKIARIINSRMGYDLDLRYLHTSREAWCWPAIQEIGTFDLSWMLDLNDDLKITLNSIAQRLSVNSDLLLDLTNKADLNINSVDISLNLSQIEQLKNILASPEFLHLLQPRIDSSYQNTIAYLTQEGIFDGTDFALVDVGWRGRLQYALSKMMDKHGKRPAKGLTGFYFGLHNNEINQYKNDQLACFFIDSTREYLRNDILFEVFAASAAYHTTGYTYSQGKHCPIFNDKRVSPDQWDILFQQDRILAFVNSFFSAYPKKSYEPKEAFCILEKILKLFIFSPSIKEANVYGDFPLSVRFLEGHFSKIAPPWESTAKAFPKTYWIPGTLVRSKLAFLTFLWQAIAYNPALVKRCRKLYVESFWKKDFAAAASSSTVI